MEGREPSVLFERTTMHGVCVACQVPMGTPADATRLHPDELAHAARWPAARARSWLAGRTALRLALAGAGLQVPGPILGTPRGAPEMPAHVAASVSHKAARDAVVAVALVAPGATGPVGVDLEGLDPARPELARGVLSPSEALALEGAPATDRWPALLARFCLKEAAFKALDPLYPCDLDLREVSADPQPDGRATLTWPPRYPVSPRRLSARWEVVGRWMLATARVLPGEGAAADGAEVAP